MVVGIDIRVIPQTPITAICTMMATKMASSPIMIVFIRLRWLLVFKARAVKNIAGESECWERSKIRLIIIRWATDNSIIILIQPLVNKFNILIFKALIISVDDGADCPSRDFFDKRSHFDSVLNWERCRESNPAKLRDRSICV